MKGNSRKTSTHSIPKSVSLSLKKKEKKNSLTFNGSHHHSKQLRVRCVCNTVSFLIHLIHCCRAMPHSLNVYFSLFRSSRFLRKSQKPFLKIVTPLFIVAYRTFVILHHINNIRYLSLVRKHLQGMFSVYRKSQFSLETGRPCSRRESNTFNSFSFRFQKQKFHNSRSTCF
jgi:hypothetical protein